MQIYNLKKNTKPFVAHFNSVEKKFLENGVMEDIISGTTNIELPNDLEIITFSDIKRKENFPLIKQLDFCNIKYNNIGLETNEKWSNSLKPRLLGSFLDKKIFTKYILILDSSDILLSDKICDILTEYLKFNKKIVYSSGKQRFPDVTIQGEEYEYYKFPYMFLNGGCVIGETESIKSFIKYCSTEIEVKNNLWSSEQYILRYGLVNYSNKDDIGIDYGCKLFQTLGKCNYKRINNAIFVIN